MYKHTWLALFLLLLSMPLALTAQESAQPQADASSLPDAPSYVHVANSAAPPVSLAPPTPTATPAIIKVETPRPPRFQWQAATRQSMTLLMFQHAARMAQFKTREEMSGPFFEDYATSITNIGGWGDGDSVLTNYVAHPMMGAITGYVQVQNDLGGIYQEFGGSRHYWNSRLRALAFSAAYSTQFEIGPLSEAAFGNVGMKKGTAGWVDLVMTPTGGFGLMVAEDALDRHAISKWESGSSGSHKRVLRMLLNPNRSLANLLRMKVPWHRDTRPMFPRAMEENAAARQPSAERKEFVVEADGTFRFRSPRAESPGLPSRALTRIAHSKNKALVPISPAEIAPVTPGAN